MELTLAEVQKAKKPLETIVQAPLEARVAFRLSRLAKTINDIYIDIEKQRSSLVEKHGAINPEGGMTVTNENMEAFYKELEDLMSNEKVELNIQPIDLDLLDGVKLSALDMLALEPFIKE